MRKVKDFGDDALTGDGGISVNQDGEDALALGVTNDALAKLCDKYGLIEAELRAPPNYALLLDLPTFKLIEYSRVALTPRQRKSLIFMLRDFLPKRY